MSLIIEALKDMRVIGEGIGYAAEEAIRASTKRSTTNQFWPAFVDLFCLWMDWMPVPGSPITKVHRPVAVRTFTMGEAYEARVVWRWILTQQTNPSGPKKEVLNRFNSWHARYTDSFVAYYEPGRKGNQPEEMDFLEFFRDIFEKTTKYFEAMELKYRRTSSEGNGSSRFASAKLSTFYANLVCSHVKVNALSLQEAEVSIAAGKHRNDKRVGMQLRDTLFTERAFVYADNVHLMVEEMRGRGYDGVDSVRDIEDAWWMLMLRAQVAEMGMVRVPNPSMKVPSSYYVSPTRVYIM